MDSYLSHPLHDSIKTNKQDRIIEKTPFITLGIETSCDDAGVAVYSSQTGMLSTELFSQIQEHKTYGGVVPEIASRTQLKKIKPITGQALTSAGLTLDEIDAIAVTHKPGLPGSLLVGLCFAKALAWSKNKWLIGIDHLEGHIFSACIENDIPFPFLCLTASGGHTALYLVEDFGVYTMIGHTRDDAAGEALDKISKLIGYGYPGGPIIEKLALEIDFQDVFCYPRPMKDSFDFSFSGLKTAVIYDLAKRGAYDIKTKCFTAHDDTLLKQQVASSLLVCINDIFVGKLKKAFKTFDNIRSVAFAGGVACNKFIRKNLTRLCEQHDKKFYAPSPKFCTDNGGMIAFVGNYKAQQGVRSQLTLDIF